MLDKVAKECEAMERDWYFVDCTVVNKYKESYDVYIGRGTKWGNPYSVNAEKSKFDVLSCSDLDECIEMYANHLWEMIKDGRVTKADLRELAGKKLGCFCKPKKCHGDVIVQAVEWAIRS